mgnify:CR=1 FL=1|jgi:hypothetical protein
MATGNTKKSVRTGAARTPYSTSITHRKIEKITYKPCVACGSSTCIGNCQASEAGGHDDCAH